MVSPSDRVLDKPFGGGGWRDDAGYSWKEPVSFTPTELQNLFSHSENHQHKRIIKSFKRTFFDLLVRKLFVATWQMPAACWLPSSQSKGRIRQGSCVCSPLSWCKNYFSMIISLALTSRKNSTSLSHGRLWVTQISKVLQHGCFFFFF